MTIGLLSELCHSKDLAAHNACKFYIYGAFQQAGLAVGKYCIPEDVDSDKMELLVRDLMARDLEFYPEDNKLEAIGMVGAVIALKYTCPKR